VWKFSSKEQRKNIRSMMNDEHKFKHNKEWEVWNSIVKKRIKGTKRVLADGMEKQWKR